MSIIETARLILRPPTEADAAAIVHGVGNFNVSKNLARDPHPYHMSEALDFLKFITTTNTETLICAIVLKSQPQELIGMISYEFEGQKNQAELGYWLAEPYWGQGIGKEAAHAIVGHAFLVAKLDQLIASYHDENEASARTLLRLGFKVTGHAMHFSKARGTEIKSTTVKLLRENWRGRN